MASRITTPTLDNMNRADEDPLYGGGIWGVVDPVDYPTDMRLFSHRAKGRDLFSATDVFTSRWLPQTFSGDVQIWSIPYQPPIFYFGGGHSSLRLFQNAGLGTSTINGYIANFQYNGGVSSTCRLYRMDNSIATLLDTQSAGFLWGHENFLLLETLDDKVRTSWYDAASDTWSTLNEVTDNTHRDDLSLVLALIDGDDVPGEWQSLGGGEANTDFVPQIIRRWTVDH